MTASGVATVSFAGLFANRLPGAPLKWSEADGDGLPSPVAMPLSMPLSIVVAVDALGSNEYVFAGEVGDFTEGSTDVTAIPSTSHFLVGQQIQDYDESIESMAFLPTGPNFITALTASTLTFANYPEPPGSPSLGALQSGTAVPFKVADPYPLGNLVFSISPTTGWTMIDVNADGTGSTGNEGNGTFVANLSGQAEGSVVITFDTAGTYTINCTYEPSATEVNYLAASVPTSLSVVAA